MTEHERLEQENTALREALDNTLMRFNAAKEDIERLTQENESIKAALLEALDALTRSLYRG